MPGFSNGKLVGSGDFRDFLDDLKTQYPGLSQVIGDKGFMKVLGQIKNLHKDCTGQVLVLIISILFVLILCWFTIPNVTAVTVYKMKAQTAADAGAYRDIFLFVLMGCGERFLKKRLIKLLPASVLKLEKFQLLQLFHQQILLWKKVMKILKN